MIQDTVLVNQTRIAHIERILLPGTKEADDYSTPGGGFLLHFEDGDVQAWDNTDEDIQFVKRGTKNDDKKDT